MQRRRLLRLAALLVQPRRVGRLLEPLEDRRAVAAALRVVALHRDLHAARDVAEAERHPRDAGAARLRLRGVARREAVVEHREGGLVLLAELELHRKLARDRRHLVGREGLRELERHLPVEEVAAHLEGGDRVRRREEELLRQVVVPADEGDVAGEEGGVVDAL